MALIFMLMKITLLVTATTEAKAKVLFRAMIKMPKIIRVIGLMIITRMITVIIFKIIKTINISNNNSSN